MVALYQTTAEIEQTDKVVEAVDLEVNPELPTVLRIYAITVE